MFRFAPFILSRLLSIIMFWWGRSGLVARSPPRDRRVPGPKPESTEDPPCKWARYTLNPSGPTVLPLVWCRSLERLAPAQGPSPPSDRGSKLRGASQNIPRIASKRDVNITKLN
ncbi:hypothetical protein AVEN_2875-1 [Araneus ventricosus]|uniref:Secreted protein n=1 Tax=Araneus ventricosus TaxID=182803 RepID=A0A4Y2D1Q7_ARAVE|nr:hypothetical protein AVEN_2875-1 [Araneus ventricosus]